MNPESADHRLRNVLLYGHDVLELTVVRLGPECAVAAVRDVHELYRHLESAAGPPRTTLEHVIHMERLGNGARAEALVLERKHRRPPRDGEHRNLAQCADELVGEA